MCSTLTPDPRGKLNPLTALQKHHADLLQQQRDMQQYSRKAAAAVQPQKEAVLEQQQSLQLRKAGGEHSAVKAEQDADQQKAARSWENQSAFADSVSQLQQSQQPVAAALQLPDSAAPAVPGSLESGWGIRPAANLAANNCAAASDSSSQVAPQQEVAAVQHGREPVSAGSHVLNRSASPADASREQGGASNSSPAGGTGAGVLCPGGRGLSSDGSRPAYGRRSFLQGSGSQLDRQQSRAVSHWQSAADTGLPADSPPGRGHQPEQQSEVGSLETRPPAPAAVRALPTVSQMQGAKAATVAPTGSSPVPGRHEQQMAAAFLPASPALALEPAASQEGATTSPSTSQTGLSTPSDSVYTPPAMPSRQPGTTLAAQQGGGPDAHAESASSDEFSYFTNSLAVGSADINNTQLPKAGAAPAAQWGAEGAALQQRAAASGVVLRQEQSGGSLAATGRPPESAAVPKAEVGAGGLLQLSRVLPEQQQEQEQLPGHRRLALARGSQHHVRPTPVHSILPVQMAPPTDAKTCYTLLAAGRPAGQRSVCLHWQGWHFRQPHPCPRL